MYAAQQPRKSRGIMGGNQAEPQIADDEVVAAFKTWARGVTGAPRRLEAQITRVSDGADESVVRLATEIIRRELVQGHAPAFGRVATGTAVAEQTVDPFAGNLEQLKARTERVVGCNTCTGTGRGSCRSCGGSGRATCTTCSGSGQVRRYYKKSSRMVRCTVCRGTCTVSCGECAATGSVPCATCEGAGAHRVWWTFQERVYTVVRFAAETPVLAAHPHLREERLLRPADLTSFRTVATHDAAGALDIARLGSDDRAICDRLAPPFNPRLERMRAQQLVRFAALRRDVEYELCGSRSTVVLSGSPLVAGSTSDAARPIRRRLVLWGLATVLLAIGGSQYYSLWSGPTAYFTALNERLALTVASAVALGVVAAGGLLRAWRPGPRIWPLRTGERLAMLAALVAVGLCPVWRSLGRPRLADARAALARGDQAGARLVTSALAATEPSPETARLADELDLMESESLGGEARLSLLDAVGARTGAQAETARTRARSTRLTTARAELTAGRPRVALAMLDRWAPALAGDADAAELRGSVHDAEYAACETDTCRLESGRRAVQARPTDARRAAVTLVRERLLRVLSDRSLSSELVAKTRALRALSRAVEAVAAVSADDGALSQAAREASIWAESERTRIPLLGAPPEVVDDILDRDPENHVPERVNERETPRA